MMAAQQSRRRVGRPPKYDWGDKRDICYRLYVEEKKSAEKIIKYFTEHFNVDAKELPWQRLTPEEEARTTARMKGLWERNLSQKEIIQILKDEGYGIGKHEFGLLWKKNGFRLRNHQGFQVPNSNSPGKRKRDDVQKETSDAINTSDIESTNNHVWQVAQQYQYQSSRGDVTTSEAEETVARANRIYQLQVESDRKLQTGNRRRRIRGFGPFAADAPGLAPRYASETTLDECKAYLHLSNEMYTTIRADFQIICTALGIVKKAQCAEGIWEEGKSRLVRENLHLSAMFHPLQPDQEKKSLALDCICVDVTKRVRASSRALTIADANNYLDLNPTESKAVRRSLYEILEIHKFESRLISGAERWDQLHQQWLNNSEKLQLAMETGDSTQLRSVDVLCRDALKRYRDDKVRRGERTVFHNSSNYGPGPGPARPAGGLILTKSKSSTVVDSSNQSKPPKKIIIREPRVRAAVESRGYYEHPSGNLLMSLAQSTGNIDFDIDPTLTSNTAPAVPDRSNTPISAYFSLAPGSNIVGNHPRTWLGKLTSATIESVHKAATRKLGAAQVAKTHGLIKTGAGIEDSWLIESQDELDAYLQEAGEKPKFAILIKAGYA